MQREGGCEARQGATLRSLRARCFGAGDHRAVLLASPVVPVVVIPVAMMLVMVVVPIVHLGNHRLRRRRCTPAADGAAELPEDRQSGQPAKRDGDR